ncbi:MAG: hypothetical protein F9Y92_05965, partial [Thermoplasmatales archaeon]|nr:hypothetical protein [Thermoplasmatales archaeon]
MSEQKKQNNHIKKHVYKKTNKKVTHRSATDINQLINNNIVKPEPTQTTNTDDKVYRTDEATIPTTPPQIPDLPKPNYDFPIDDFVLKAIRRITDMALYLQNYTFVFIYIPGFFNMLTDWKKIDLKSKETKEIVTEKIIVSGTDIRKISITRIGKYYSEESASFGNCMIDAYLHSASNNFDFKSTPKLRNDWDEFSSAPIAVSENDFILFTPYTLISTNLN